MDEARRLQAHRGEDAFIRRSELKAEMELMGAYVGSQVRPLRERLTERIEGIEGIVSSHSRRADGFLARFARLESSLEAAQFSWAKVSERLFEELQNWRSSLLKRIEHEANRSPERLDVERMKAIQERLGRLEDRISPPTAVSIAAGDLDGMDLSRMFGTGGREVLERPKSGWQQTAEMQAIELEAKDGLIEDYKRKLMDCENERQEAIAEIHAQRKAVAEVTINRRELSSKLQGIIDEKDRIIDDLKRDALDSTILLKCSECDTSLVFAASTLEGTIGIQIEPHACEGRAQRKLVSED